MKILTTDPPPDEMEEFLARRKANGQDLYDEVWEGVYHMVNVPPPWHGYLQVQVTSLLDRPARDRHLLPIAPFNLGEENNFRCTDGGVLGTVPTDDLCVPTALIVVEIVAPDDESFDKFDFYWDRGVEEILTVEQNQRVTWWERRSDYRPVLASDVLGTTTDYFSDQIRWP